MEEENRRTQGGHINDGKDLCKSGENGNCCPPLFQHYGHFISERLLKKKRDPQLDAVSRIRQLNLALLQYAQDHQGALPNMSSEQDLKSALKGYVKDDQIMIDPISGMPFQPNSYLTGKYLEDFSSAYGVISFYQKTPFEGERCISLLKGDGELASQQRWCQLMTSSHISLQW